MASSQAANLGINYGWSLGESGWNVQMDENLLALDALTFLSVKSATLATPPGSPVDGDRYLVAGTATDAWLGQEGDIAQYVTSTADWRFFTPREGWETRAEDSQQRYVYSSSNWVLEGSLYTGYADDAAASAGGIPVGGTYINSSSGAITIRQV